MKQVKCSQCGAVALFDDARNSPDFSVSKVMNEGWVLSFREEVRDNDGYVTIELECIALCPICFINNLKGA